MSVGFSELTSQDDPRFGRLRDLLREVARNNPFYRCKLAAAGNPGAWTTWDEFFAHVPFTTKAELSADQAAHPPYGTNLTHPLTRYTRCHQTSGSSGQPIRWLDTNESWTGLLDNWGEIYRAAGVTAADPVFFAFSFGPFIGFWTAFEAALRIGCRCIPGGGMNSATRLRALIANGATVLCCTPTYALRLAEVARAEAIPLAESAVRLIIVAGEPGGSLPAFRETVARVWNGARVFDHYGMTEVGPVAHECRERPGALRVIERAYLAEILDAQSGRPVPAGQPGELVLTTLNRTAAPVIRYRTGDLVKALPRELNPPGVADLCLDGGILGRVDDMVVVRGVNVYPTAVDEIIRETGGVGEYQVRVLRDRALTELEIAIEAGGDAERTRARLEKRLQERLALRVPVKLAPAGTLPRFEMKARRWLRDPSS